MPQAFPTKAICRVISGIRSVPRLGSFDGRDVRNDAEGRSRAGRTQSAPPAKTAIASPPEQIYPREWRLFVGSSHRLQGERIRHSHTVGSARGTVPCSKKLNGTPLIRSFDPPLGGQAQERDRTISAGGKRGAS